jgi:tetratricopeptide (TPR) repeat protein
MAGNEWLKSFFREADIYYKQGLFSQSMKKYSEIMELIKNNPDFSGNTSLLEFVDKKIETLKGEIEDIDNETDPPELDDDTQGLISDLFSFSGNREMAAIEGASALVSFGQYDKALKEFERLIDSRIYPLVAAKNMLECLVSHLSSERAVIQYRQWVSSNIFTKMELKHLREYLLELLKNRGQDDNDSSFTNDTQLGGEKAAESNEILEIFSVVAFIEKGSCEGKQVNLDVACQISNNLSCLVKPEDKDTINALTPGLRISQVHCYSLESVLTTSALVLQREQIMSGPQKGCYSFDIKLGGV